MVIASGPRNLSPSGVDKFSDPDQILSSENGRFEDCVEHERGGWWCFLRHLPILGPRRPNPLALLWFNMFCAFIAF